MYYYSLMPNGLYNLTLSFYLFSLSFSKRQREEKRMEVKLPKMQLSFLSLFYNSLFIFTLLIDC